MIRQLQKEDVSAFKEMCKAFYSSDAVLNDIPEENIDNFIKEALSSDVYAKCYIIECEGEIAGYAVTAKTFSQEAGGLVLWIEEAYVKKEYRNRGLGKEFFEFILKTPGIKRFRLEVEEENVRARKLYSALGFSDFAYGQMLVEK